MRLGRILALVLTGAAVVASTAAFAHGGARGRVGVGVYVAPPPIYWGPPAPRYYYGPRPFYPGYGYGYGYGYAAPIYPGPVYGGAIYGPYPPAVWGTTAPPSAYVERTPLPEQQGAPAASADAAQSGYWHYCQNPEGYYPQVKECPAGWIRVLPQQQQPAGR